jgi:hypothetical protein
MTTQIDIGDFLEILENGDLAVPDLISYYRPEITELIETGSAKIQVDDREVILNLKVYTSNE